MGFRSGVDKLGKNGHGAFDSESSVKFMHFHLSVEKKRNRIISDIMIDVWNNNQSTNYIILHFTKH